MRCKRLLAFALAVAAAMTFSAVSAFAADAVPDPADTPSADVSDKGVEPAHELNNDDDPVDVSYPDQDVTTAGDGSVSGPGNGEGYTQRSAAEEPAAVDALQATVAAPLADDTLGAVPETDAGAQSETVNYTLGAPHYQYRIIGMFDRATTADIQPVVLRAGQVLADGEPVDEGQVRYTWHCNANSSSGQQAVGSAIGYERNLFLGSVGRSQFGIYGHPGGFTTDNPGSQWYRVVGTVGSAKTEPQMFNVVVASELKPFDLLHAQESSPDIRPDANSLENMVIKTDLCATPEHPVTLTADIDPTDAVRVEQMVKQNYYVQLNYSNLKVTGPGHVRWMVVNNYAAKGVPGLYSSGRFEETQVDGKPTLILKGSALEDQSDTQIIYCVVDFEYTDGSRKGLIEYHSKPVAVNLQAVDDISKLPTTKKWFEWGVPGSDGGSSSTTPTPTPGTSAGVQTCAYFNESPLTVQECTDLYKDLVGKYLDTRYQNKPLKLKPAEMNADGTALSEQSQQELLGVVNFIRRCAGVGGRLSIDAAKSDYAQAGAVYNDRHNLTMSGHDGARGDTSPEGMKADYALQHSNISWATGPNSDRDFVHLLRNQFRDDDGGNWPGLGHRRWLLDNRTTTMGFGYSTGLGTGEHLLVFIKDDKVNNGFAMAGPNPGFEAYPGYGAFPVELMDCKGWSLTLGNGWTIPNEGVSMRVVRDEGTAAEYAVDLTRVSRSAAWSSTGDIFTADSMQAGSGPILTFSPGSMYPNGDVWNAGGLAGHTYTIHITGLEKGGFETMPEVVYSTQFFSLASALSGYTPPVASQPAYTPPATAAPIPTPIPAERPTPTLISTEIPTATPTPSESSIVPPLPDPPIVASAVPTPTMAASPTNEDVASEEPKESSVPIPTTEHSPESTPAPTKAPAPMLSAVTAADDMSGTPNEEKPAAIVSVLGTQIAVAKPQKDGACTTVADLLDGLLVSSGTIEVRTVSGDHADSNTPAATGMMVYAYDDDGMLREVYPIVVPYDVLGTGTMSLSQLIRLARGFTGTEPLHGIYLDAGAQTRSGIVTLSDLVKVARLLTQP